jgi:DNA repair protein SbcD/Mre11
MAAMPVGHTENAEAAEGQVPRVPRSPREGGAVRVVHFSDTHLGHQQYPRVDEHGLNQRERDLYDAFDAVIDHAIRTKADLVVHAGDLFDGVRPSNRALAHALEGFLRLSKAGIPAVVIAGNHEHPKLRETGSSFRLFAHLEGIHPVYQGKRQTIDLALQGRPVRVHAVPQCPDQESIAREIADAPVAQDGGIDLLVVHGAVTTLADIPQAEFNELSLEPSWFAPFHHVALGHFHGVKQAAANSWYCGAPDRVSMAESGQDKGFLEVTFPPGSTRPDVRFVALPVRPYADLPVLRAEGMDGGQIVAAAREALARAPEGAVARLRIEGIAPELRGSLDRRAIQDAAKHVLHLDLRPEFAGHASTAAGPTGFRGLVAEFDSFAAVTPMPGLDRDAVVALAKSMLVGGPAP